MTTSLQPDQPLDETPSSRSSLKRFFLRGLILLLPTLITLWLLVKAVGFLYINMIRHTTRLIGWTFSRVGLYPSETYWVDNGQVHMTWALRVPSEVISWTLCVSLVILAGIIFSSFLGRRLWLAAENMLMRLPPMRFIYPYVKQVTDFFFTKRAVGYHQVVAIEYPRKGCWSLGFVTGRAFSAIERKLDTECLSIFVPSSPTPMTGYVVFVPKDDVIYLSLSIEDAFKMIISGGVIKPELLVEQEGSPSGELTHLPEGPRVP